MQVPATNRSELDTAARNSESHPVDFSPVNVYQMFVANGNQPGFWLTRTTWNSKCARVLTVGDLKGPAPYFGNPKVHAALYDSRTGALISRRIEITAAGTYKTWRQVPTPQWWAPPSSASPSV